MKLLRHFATAATLATLLAWCAPAHAATASAQAACTTQQTAQNVGCTFGSNVTSGDVLWAFAGWSSTTVTVSSITTSAGCGTVTLTLLSNPTTGPTGRAVMGYGIATGTGSCTVTINKSASVLTNLIVHDISGVDNVTPLDLTPLAINVQGSPGTGTDAVTSGPQTSVSNGDYIAVGTFGDSGNGETQTHGTGFTSSGVINTSFKASAEFLIQGAAGSQAGTFTISANSDMLTGMVMFRPAATASAIRLRSLMGVGQ